MYIYIFPFFSIFLNFFQSLPPKHLRYTKEILRTSENNVPNLQKKPIISGYTNHPFQDKVLGMS